MTLWLARNGADQLSFSQGVVAIELSILLAWATTRFVEKPIRAAAPAVAAAAASAQPSRRSHRSTRRNWRPALMLGSLVTVLALTLGAWWGNISRLTSRADAATNPGAAVLAADYDGPQIFDTLTPSPASLSKQWPQWSPTSCTQYDTYGPLVSICDYVPEQLDAASAADAPVIMVFGSSHVDTWNTLLQPLADREGLRLRVIVGPGCDLWAYSDDDPELTEQTEDACAAQNQVAWDSIQTDPPSAVFTTGDRSVPDSAETHFDSRTVTRMEQITELGVPVIALRDNPRFSTPLSTCVVEHKDTALGVEECAVSRSSVLAAGDMADLMPAQLQEDPLVIPMDLSDLFCPDDVCLPAIGGVLVYLDANHPTRAYVETLAPQFSERFMAALQDALIAQEDVALAVTDTSAL